MRGKVIEAVLFLIAVIAQTASGAATLFNGVASGGTNGIDTQRYDEAVVTVNVGIIAASGTLDITVFESDTNDSSGATLIAGATFTQFTPANDLALYTGSIKVKNYKRYIWVKSVQSAHAIVFGATVALGKGDVEPAANSPVFDINHTA